MRMHFLAVFGAAMSCIACSSTPAPEPDARPGLLASLPSMPSLPTIHMPDVNLANIHLPGTNRQAPQVDPDLEPVVYWRVIDDDILVVHADTHGCTVRSDFTVDVEQYHRDVYTVRLVRSQPDRCGQTLPWGAQLGFGFEELGVPIGGRVIVLNPIDQRAWDWNESGRQDMAQR
ncbi:hypothetical protein [Maricaulis sp.]|uniref:hypothetical protein n=1 Tax=Maricaulis sp. TaxID=1486257 RepID=UPI003A8E0A25